MYIKHELAGDFVMMLSDAEIAQLHRSSGLKHGYGLNGPYSDVIVRYAESEAEAYVDEDALLAVYIPRNDEPEVVIENADVYYETDSAQIIKRRFLGETGRVILQASHLFKTFRWQ